MLLYRKRCLHESQRKTLRLSFVRKFHRKKSVLVSLFNKVAGLKICNIIKKRLQHRCFPVKFCTFLRTPFFTEYLRWLLLERVIKKNNEEVSLFGMVRVGMERYLSGNLSHDYQFAVAGRFIVNKL